MANHCHYAKCFNCGDEYCLLGCGYNCECGKQMEDPNIKQKEEKQIKDYYKNNPMPDGWF